MNFIHPNYIIFTNHIQKEWFHTDGIQEHYQKHLLSLILDLTDRGFNTGEISRKLTEMGYLSVRGKPLLSKHVWSMIEKNRVRLERSKEFQREIRNFRWVCKNQEFESSWD